MTAHALATPCPGCRIAVEPDHVKDGRRYFTHDCETTPAWDHPYAPPAPRLNAAGRLAALKVIDDGPIAAKDWETAYVHLAALESAGSSDRWRDAIAWLNDQWANPSYDRSWVVLQARIFLGIANAPAPRKYR